MNPYANAFSHLMSQFPTTNPQYQHPGHQTSTSAPIPPYHVYIPGPTPPSTMQSPYPCAHGQYTMPPLPPSALQQPHYPYPMYQQYPGGPMYPPVHSHYPSQHAGHVYATPTVYPMVQNAAPSSFHPQGHTFQNKHNASRNLSKQFNKPMQKKHITNANVPSVTPTTPAVAASQEFPFSTSQNNAHNQPFSFPSSSETASRVAVTALLPSSMSYFCEACDKEFPNQSTYNSHCSTHEMCSYPDCTFTASKRVVQAHFHSTHGLYSGQGYKDIDVEGQSFRVLLGTSPEEVAQWRAERRKKFPSSDRASISTNNDTANVLNSLENGNNNNNNNVQKGKKSLAAQKREEWKLKKQQQRLERQHYKQLRNAHHGPNNMSENDANEVHEQPSRNFIQIKSQSSTKGIEISTIAGEENAEEVTSIRLPSSSEGNEDKPAKRARFDSTADISPQKQRQQRNSNEKKRQPNNSLLRKPDISGNLLAKLLLNEIRAEENLLLQSIRFLRQLYDPRCQIPENVNSTVQASDTNNIPQADDATLEKDVINLSSEEKKQLIQQLTTMDIDELITEAQNVPDDLEEGAEEGHYEEEEEEEIEFEGEEEEIEAKGHETNDEE